jgi:hypothetical protein
MQLSARSGPKGSVKKIVAEAELVTRSAVRTTWALMEG